MEALNQESHAKQLLAFQKLAQSTLVLSMTRRCPLSCPHCITQSHPGFSGPVVSNGLATRWALEMPDLAAAGIRHITFTGGEPVLARSAVETLANAAKGVGIRTAIVTGGGWVSTPSAARRVVDSLRGVNHWDVGYDQYHGQEIDWERFDLLISTLTEFGCSFSVRVCSGKDNAMWLRRIRLIVGDDVTVMLQPIKSAGRAMDFDQPVRVGGEPSQPCVSSGPLILETGVSAPCCSILGYASLEHIPFAYGSADVESLLTIWQRWRGDQLLRLMRLLGLQWPLQWALDLGFIGEDFVITQDVCDTCVRFWTRLGEHSGRLVQHVENIGLEQILDDVELQLFGSR
jgi:hypothetical protein